MSVLPFTPLARIQLEDRLAEMERASSRVRHWSYVLAHGTRGAQRRAKYELPAAEAAVEQARRRVEDAERDLAMIEEAEARNPMIVFHGMPPSLDELSETKVFGGRALMVSFGTAAQRLERYAALASSLALDNGAFSEWKKGAPLDVNGFFAWAGRATEYPSMAWFLAPDVIDGDENANDDLLYSVPRHLKPWAVPVWHLHESTDRLKRLCSEFLRVALGSSGVYAKPNTVGWWGRIAEAFGVIPRTTRVHGLRMADPEIVRRCPFASVDSTTAGRNASNHAKWAGGALEHAKEWVRAEAYAQGLEATRAPLVFSASPREVDPFTFALGAAP